MRVAVAISSYNEKSALKRCIQSLLEQTYPVQEIIVVDNRSSDGTTLETFSEKVTLICHIRNIGPTGAVATAFQYALERGYDWLWVLDLDSVPRPDALERLVGVYNDLAPEQQGRVGLLSSHMVTAFSDRVTDHFVLSPKGPRVAHEVRGKSYCECDCTIWTGSLVNLKAVTKVGFPRYGVEGYWQEFGFDWGDIEFCYRLRQAGYKVIVDRSSLIEHSVGSPIEGRLFGKMTSTSNHAAFRRYLHFRNMVYFWCYIYSDKNLFAVLLYICSRSIKDIVKIIMMENGRIPKIRAILRGIWDGAVRRNLGDAY